MAWCMWTAVLAGMPYGVWSFEPLAPGQVGTTALSLAALLFVFARLLSAPASEAFPRAVPVACRVLACVGGVATAGLAVCEGYALVRGDSVLMTDAQIATETAFLVLELVLSVIAVLCWALYTAGLGVRDASPSPRRVVGAFLAGGAWPVMGLLVAQATRRSRPLSTIVICAAAFGIALCVARWRLSGRGSFAGEVPALLAGHVSFVAFRSLVGEYRIDIFSAGPSDLACYGFFAALLAVLSGALLLAREREGRREERARGEARPQDETPVTRDDATACMEAALEAKARRPLTRREAAVLARTALGVTAKVIASDLGLAEATVATYRRRGYEKLGVSGARELRELAGSPGSTDAESEPGPELGDGAPSSPPGDDPAGVGLGPGVREAVALALAVLLLLPYFTNNIQIGGVWYHRGSLYWTWLVVMALSFAYVARATVTSRDPARPRRAFSPLGPCASALVSAFLTWLISTGTFCAWDGYDIYRLWSVFLLAAASLAMGLACGPGTAGPVSLADAFRALLRGFGRLFLDEPLLVLLASLSVASACKLQSYFIGVVAEWIRTLFPMASVMAAACLVRLAREAAVPIVRPTDGELERATHYLRGRGLDELRAQIVLDLVCGYGVAAICQRRCTTAATVRSYRRRTYRDFGVHTLGELRTLMRTEANFTGLDRVHPAK